MSIQISCRSCGREYQIKDENAGRKFRCKDCGEVNIANAPGGPSGGKSSADGNASPKRRQSAGQAGSTGVPSRPKKRKPAPVAEPQEDEYSYDDYGAEDYAEYDDYGAGYEEEYTPPARSSRKASSAKKPKKKKKNSGSGAGMKAVKIVAGAFGGLFGLLVVVGVVARLFNAGIALNPNVTISTQTPPGSGFQLDMPQMPVRGIQPMPGASATKWTANKRPFEFIVIRADLPAGAAAQLGGIDQIAAMARSNSEAQGHKIVSEKRTTLGGFDAVEFTMDVTRPHKGRGRLRVAVIGDQLWTILVAVNGTTNLKDDLCERYFNSFNLVTDAAPATSMRSETLDRPILAGM